MHNNEPLKQRLIEIRQEPSMLQYKSDLRKAIRYIEKLEYLLNRNSTKNQNQGR